eukprot:TRINITY_DN29_c0_g2_i1.p2 TRINITY_DN29_c0_g2~~TRINITY_DN29_c0_g2_i1.p2  ORF type:complete len:453 (+),score=47.03 TRINITY_DN29_c0_g2_i1:2304-3662(+)
MRLICATGYKIQHLFIEDVEWILVGKEAQRISKSSERILKIPGRVQEEERSSEEVRRKLPVPCGTIHFSSLFSFLSLSQMTTEPVIVNDTAPLLDKMRITPFRREFDNPRPYVKRSPTKKEPIVTFSVSTKQAAVDATKDYITEPSALCDRNFPSLLRKREPEKEIQPGMYYKSNTEVERLLESLQKNFGLANGKEDLKKLVELFGEKSIHSLSRSSPEKKRKINLADIAKKLRPELHNKTHFRAVLALVHKSSKALIRSGEVTPVAVNTQKPEPEDMEEALESFEESCSPGNHVVFPVKMQVEEQKKSRCESLPPIPSLTFRNVSPLKERKAKENMTREATFSLEPQKIDTTDKYRSIMKGSMSSERLPKIRRKIQFQLPLSPPRTPPLEIKSETEELGKKVLKMCKVFPFNKRIDVSPQLRKGEGHTIAGFGKSNKDAYERVFGADSQQQ